MYIYIYIDVYVYSYTHIYAYICTRIYIYIHICVCVYYVNVYVFRFISMYLPVYVGISVRLHAPVAIHRCDLHHYHLQRVSVFAPQLSHHASVSACPLPDTFSLQYSDSNTTLSSSPLPRHIRVCTCTCDIAHFFMWVCLIFVLLSSYSPSHFTNKNSTRNLLEYTSKSFVCTNTQ